MAPTVSAPVPESYEFILASNLAVESVELITITEFPSMYARPVPTVRDTVPPGTGVMVAEDDWVL
jgi:hypothetical protein